MLLLVLVVVVVVVVVLVLVMRVLGLLVPSWLVLLLLRLVLRQRLLAGAGGACWC